MTDPHLLPAPLRAWAENTLGALASVRNASPQASSTGLWHVVRACDSARFDIKIARTPDGFTSETFAYRHAVPALGPGRAPRLLATSPRHLALLVTALPGTPLSQLRLTEGALREVHWRAGSLIAQLHQAGRPSGAAHQAASSALSHLADQAADHLDAVGDCLAADEKKFVMDLADRLRVIDHLPLGFVHGGDLASALVCSGRSQLAVHGFASARFAPVVLDFAGLACGYWSTWPRLRTPFFNSYGRTLAPEERLALHCLMALHVVRSLAQGRALGDRTAADSARALLGRLRNEVSV
ncbi:phosphotransferase [Streptomyces aureus]|uniref:phosphotransferase n=1 Tax=Streptomyces aureus TaxID=193461 RepID=UPI0006896712|nr:phosphotransferase [Streptomyces aureus]